MVVRLDATSQHVKSHTCKRVNSSIVYVVAPQIQHAEPVGCRQSESQLTGALVAQQIVPQIQQLDCTRWSQPFAEQAGANMGNSVSSQL